MESDKNPLSAIPVVQLSQKGIFKYILIDASVRNKDQSQNITFVRGNDQKEYHADNFRDFIY